MPTKQRIKPQKYLPIILVFIALGARLIPGPRTIDDSYITFRYARNLLNGEGFVYNPGERVQGTTTPLYTLLMTGLGAAAGGSEAPFPRLALGFNAVMDAVTCLLLWQLGFRLRSEWAGVVTAVLWGIAPYPGFQFRIDDDRAPTVAPAVGRQALFYLLLQLFTCQ